MKLSICMMVKDEEKNIRRCLESLKTLREQVDSELIVVDTGSKDNTVEILKEYTNNLYFHKWNNNFSEIRNVSISCAKGDWIFIIDADEELISAEKLIEFLNNDTENSQYNTVGVIGKNFLVEGEETDTGLISTLRLFRNGTIRYEGAVHNQCIFKKPIINLDVYFNHYGYISNDKELMEKKFNRTSVMLKSELEKQPKNIYYLYQLATSYEMHFDYKEALDVITKAYNIINEDNLNRSQYKYVYYRYASIENNLKDWSMIKKVCIEGIRASQEYIDLYFLLAQAQSQLNEWKESLKSYITYFNLLDNYDNLSIKNDVSIIMYTLNMKEQALNNACVSCIRLEKYEEAFDYAKEIHSSDVQQKSIPVIIKSALEMNREDDLLKYYSEYIVGNTTNETIFQTVLEDYITSSYKEKVIKVSDIFSQNEGFYSDFNKIRLYILKKSFSSVNSLIRNLIINTNWNEAPNFYGQIIYYLLKMKYPLESLFARIGEPKINEFLEYCASKFMDLCELVKNGSEFKTLDSLQIIKKNKVLSRCILIIDPTLSNEEYSKYFNIYIENGIEYMQKIYRESIFTDEIVYELKGNEEAFFLYILKSEENKINDQQLYFSYLRKALAIYPKMKRGVKILQDKAKKNLIGKYSRMDSYKKEVKETIADFIELKNYDSAKALIGEYEDIIKDDPEIYSMKAIIAINENRLNDAENFLNQGLEIDSNNEDLLFNMSYLMDYKKKDEEALECFCRAKLFNPDSNIKVEDIISNFKPINNYFRVIQGTMEIANQMNTVTKGLKKLGIDAKTINYYPNYLGYKSDYTLNLNYLNDINKANTETKKLASKVISENDVFHFHFGTSLTLDNSDLVLLKELDKKVFMQHWGSDVRMYSKAKELNRFAQVKDMNEDGIRKKLEFLANHIPACIVSDYELYEYVKNIYDKVYVVKQAIDLEKYRDSEPKLNKDKFLIVHAPSSPQMKGTEYILNAIDSLKGKYDFDFTLVKGMNHEEAKKIYAKADLIIDQLLFGSYGLFAIECMAMGKPVISWISDFMKEKYPKELPIISANPDTIKEEIEYVIKNKDMLKKIGIEGRKYVEKYHDMNKIAINMLEIYKGL